VVDVDYRGSTGYGRPFRQAIYGKWGVVDVDDCRTVGNYLLRLGVTFLGGLFISGASAGGYTALKAVQGPGPYAAAVARSAIVSPRRWVSTAPRFQKPHAAALTSADAMVRAEDVAAPVLLLHGENDEIAPIEDVAELAVALRDSGVDSRLVRFAGAGHNLATGEHRSVALEEELTLYRRVMGRRYSSS
jgi:dipeptidyl aminopeptidase/acylaminoacyl peptidase